MYIVWIIQLYIQTIYCMLKKQFLPMIFLYCFKHKSSLAKQKNTYLPFEKEKLRFNNLLMTNFASQVG